MFIFVAKLCWPADNVFVYAVFYQYWRAGFSAFQDTPWGWRFQEAAKEAPVIMGNKKSQLTKAELEDYEASGFNFRLKCFVLGC